MVTVSKRSNGDGSSNKEYLGFSTKHMDMSVDPRKDLYSHANGNWLKVSKIPADKTRWGAFIELRERNTELLREIAEQCAANSTALRGSPSRQVGDLYRSIMDTKTVEHLKFAPIEDLWQKAEQIKTTDDAVRMISELHNAGISVLFDSVTAPDDKNSTIYAFNIFQGGLSLPDREYYMADSFADARRDFLKHVARMFILKGIPKAQAGKWAETVLEIETDLAKASRTKVELRDPEKNYNKTETAALNKYKSIPFASYIREMHVPHADYVIVGQPEFFDSLDAQLRKRSPEQWKVYMLWHVLDAYASFLHKEVESANFDFYFRKLRGQKKQEDRWKRATSTVDGCLGEALGKLYVDKHFNEEAKRKVMELVNDLMEVLRDRLQNIQWMSAETRKLALIKLGKFDVKIGYPNKFRDYSSIDIRPDDCIGNIRRACAFEIKRRNSRVGEQVDRSEWYMTPPTVNAYYSSTENEIVFPAGILQPPFFDAKMDYAVNYGGIGTVIGHEMTHGFDDQGRQYDAEGNLKEWWTAEDAKKFKEKADPVVKEYSKLMILPSATVAGKKVPPVFLNGELTLGENIADLGGVSIAYEALQRRMKRDSASNETKDGLTPSQRFFLSYAQTCREKVRDKQARVYATIDPHSPERFRVIIPSVNQTAFDEAFPPKTEGEKRKAEKKEKIGVW